MRFIAEKVAGAPEAEALADEVEAWIGKHLPPDYPWPGNVRELEQCVRNMMMSRAYKPAEELTPAQADAEFFRKFTEGSLPLAEVVSRYATIVHAQTGTLRETARRLGVDRQHVAEKIDQELLTRLTRRGREAGK